MSTWPRKPSRSGSTSRRSAYPVGSTVVGRRSAGGVGTATGGAGRAGGAGGAVVAGAGAQAWAAAARMNIATALLARLIDLPGSLGREGIRRRRATGEVASAVPAQRPEDLERCVRCLLQRRVCVCAEIPRIATRTRIVIVRHISERWRSSNSGRAAALALENCELHEHGDRDAPLDAAVLDRPGSWLVFPEGDPWTEAPVP